MTSALATCILSLVVGAMAIAIAYGHQPGQDSSTKTVLADEFTPLEIGPLPAAQSVWADRFWRANTGAAQYPEKAYAVQTTLDKRIVRFELRDSDRDRSKSDSGTTRRAELSGSLYGCDERLPNGTPLWGAFSFRHSAWENPVGMAAKSGGVYGQIHMGSEFGGSPALAFRRGRDGRFRITTRGQFELDGTIHYDRSLTFDEPHDLVYRVSLHPTEGEISVWLDGDLVVEQARVSIGHDSAQSYWAFGLYFSGGIAGSVSAQYAHLAYPAPRSLRDRTTKSPAWPR